MSAITNRTVKPFIKAHDFFPGFKLEEECYSKAIISDMNQEPRSKKKSNTDDEPNTWPRQKTVNETKYERFLEQVINDAGEFYPQKDDSGAAIKNTGCYYYITDIIRVKRPDNSEFLVTKGRADAWNRLGDPVSLFISKPETWKKTNFSYKTKWNEKAGGLEKELQGPSGSEDVYTMPFNSENLKKLYDRRQNEFLNFIVKDEHTGEARQVKEVNSQKTLELFHKDFQYLFAGDYLTFKQKAANRQEAIDRGWLPGGSNNVVGTQPSNPKTNIYQ